MNYFMYGVYLLDYFLLLLGLFGLFFVLKMEKLFKFFKILNKNLKMFV